MCACLCSGEERGHLPGSTTTMQAGCSRLYRSSSSRQCAPTARPPRLRCYSVSLSTQRAWLMTMSTAVVLGGTKLLEVSGTRTGPDTHSTWSEPGPGPGPGLPAGEAETAGEIRGGVGAYAGAAASGGAAACTGSAVTAAAEVRGGESREARFGVLPEASDKGGGSELARWKGASAGCGGPTGPSPFPPSLLLSPTAGCSACACAGCSAPVLCGFWL